MIQTKDERIQAAKSKVGSRRKRKLIKYSENFNKMFVFYLQSYRKGILTFCGSGVRVECDLNSSEAKLAFREYDNGLLDKNDLRSCQSNILTAVIIGKKSWGLWCKQWAEGISEGSFRKSEILEEFSKNNIEIPDALLKEFSNLVAKKTRERYLH